MQIRAALRTLTAISSLYGFDSPRRPAILSLHPLFGGSSPVIAAVEADCDQCAADVFTELSIMEYTFRIVFCINAKGRANIFFTLLNQVVRLFVCCILINSFEVL